MNNLRGRLGSTRQVRGLGCDTDSSIFSERFDARLHGAGINDEENAGQNRNRLICQIPLGFGQQDEPLVSPNINEVGRNSWAGQCGAKIYIYEIRNLRNPCFEKGMHTRSQQFYFGGGETRHANTETLLTFGEISEVRQPASFSL